MNNTMCASCMIPFEKDTGKRESDKYCSMCFRDGKMVYQGNDLKEFQKLCYEDMVKDGMNSWKARFFVWMIRFAPRWKK